MAKITMLVDDKGSPDGAHVVEYRAGQSYDVPAELAEAFVEHRKTAVENKVEAPAEVKAASPRKGAVKGDAPDEA